MDLKGIVEGAVATSLAVGVYLSTDSWLEAQLAAERAPDLMDILPTVTLGYGLSAVLAVYGPAKLLGLRDPVGYYLFDEEPSFGQDDNPAQDEL